MKAIMISIKPKWCAKIMNGEKTIEVRKNKALANAIQKLIDENGYAEIYVYCSKDEYLYRTNKGYIAFKKPLTVGKGTEYTFAYSNEGKVVFKFRCYKADKIELKKVNDYSSDTYEYMTDALSEEELLKESCLHTLQLSEYLDGKTSCAIHISDLEIFNRPKELSEFYALKCNQKKEPCNIKDVFGAEECHRLCKMCKPLTKAPQSMVYVEVE